MFVFLAGSWKGAMLSNGGWGGFSLGIRGLGCIEWFRYLGFRIQGAYRGLNGSGLLMS